MGGAKGREEATSDYGSPQFVAIVTLRRDPPADSRYFKWGLRKGDNPLFLKGAGGAWSIIVGSATSGVAITAHRMPHMDAGVPGTARWRYISLDDGMWVPCGQACCRVDDDRS